MKFYFIRLGSMPMNKEIKVWNKLNAKIVKEIQMDPRSHGSFGYMKTHFVKKDI